MEIKSCKTENNNCLTGGFIGTLWSDLCGQLPEQRVPVPTCLQQPATILPFGTSEIHSVVSHSLRPYGLYSPWNSPGQNTGVGSLSLLQGVFPTQQSNSGLSHCRQILYQLSHQGKPRILEWWTYPFSRGSSWPRNWTGVSYTAGGFFMSWATSVWCSQKLLHRQ